MDVQADHRHQRDAGGTARQHRARRHQRQQREATGDRAADAERQADAAVVHAQARGGDRAGPDQDQHQSVGGLLALSRVCCCIDIEFTPSGSQRAIHPDRR
ncbi:MAG: hypothetical protein MZW92_54160 [Comamonadaceae bacterium]|nr:hypothetical protein [Comamonadaceae bacterium]